MLTKEQALGLYHGQELYHVRCRNADGTPQRWRVNGKTKTWKRSPERFQVPVKHGLWGFDYLTEDNADQLCLTEDEAYDKFEKLENALYDAGYRRADINIKRHGPDRGFVFASKKHGKGRMRISCWLMPDEEVPLFYRCHIDDKDGVEIAWAKEETLSSAEEMAISNIESGHSPMKRRNDELVQRMQEEVFNG